MLLPSCLKGFKNTTTSIGTTKSNRIAYCFEGTLDITEFDRTCPNCENFMHINTSSNVLLRHLPLGGNLTCLKFSHSQLFCSNCKTTKMQEINFKAKKHRITIELYQYTRDLLATNKYTLKQVADITGLGKNTVKDIDMERLKDNYTIDGKELIKPEKQAKYLGIDEFKLHNGHKYATHIIDLETGHILWIQESKKKKIVYDFIEHVGNDWMNNVLAVACDMNADFAKAFKEKYPHIKIVFDYFHIVKNFNEKVINEVRKEEQIRLAKEGDAEGYRILKKSKYILTSSKETLKKKDTKEIKIKNNQLFETIQNELKRDNEKRYDEILKKNELFFIADYVKEKLKLAYSRDIKEEMIMDLVDIVGICYSTKNKHFIWFGKLIMNHLDGIVSHAEYKISSGKIEGINNKIKTIRRQAYGLPDDEYFFLKLIDMSRQNYIRNEKSHKICD